MIELQYLKNLSKGLLTTIIIFIILSLILTLLNYFNLLNHTVLTICKMVIPLLSIVTGSFISGKKTIKNGWISGLINGLIITLFIFILSLIIKDFEFKNLIFFIIIIITSTFGSILGINAKKTA